MTTGKPRGYRLADWDDTVATLAAIRRDQGVTYAEIAETIGVTRQEISCWLQGTRMPGASRIVAIAHALGFDIALIPRTPTTEEAP